MENHTNHTNNIDTPKADLGSLTLKDLFFKYIRFIPLFVLTVAVALLVAFIYLRYADPIYRAGGTLQIKNESNISRNDKYEELFNPSGNLNVQSEIEVIRSRPLMQRVVKALNLQFTYIAVGKIRSPNVYKQTPFIIDVYEITDTTRAFTINLKFINNNQFRVNDDRTVLTFGQLFKTPNGVFKASRRAGTPGREYNIIWQPTVSVAGMYASGVVVTPKSVGTGILNISMEATNPELAADVINQLMIEYGNASIEDKKQTAKQTLEFIDDVIGLLK